MTDRFVQSGTAADYTPTTEEVRHAYLGYHSDVVKYPGPEFDRWLDNVKATAWDEGFHSARQKGEYGIYVNRQEWNPYRVHSH